MKILLILFLLLSGVMYAQTKSVEVTRTCIVCGQEWKNWEGQSNIWTYSGDTTKVGSSFTWQSVQEPTGKKWYVYLHDNAYLCDHCYSLYGGGWQEILKDKFNQLLKQAIEEQQNYSVKIKTQIKIKRLKELDEKLNSLKKEIDEAKK